MKRILSMTIALALVLSLATTAFATEGGEPPQEETPVVVSTLEELQAAVAAAENGGTIAFSAEITLDGVALETDKDITITRADTYESGSFFRLKNSAVLSGFTMENYKSSATVVCDSAAEIKHCSFVGDVEITESFIKVYMLFSKADVVISDCSFSGALYSAIRSNQNAQLSITNSTFSNNSSYAQGGAIHSSGTLILDNCTFTGNKAVSGGGVYCSGNLTITDCRFSGNQIENEKFGTDILSMGTVNITDDPQDGVGFYEESTGEKVVLPLSDFTSTASGTYSPKQIWMAHNAIMFTEDNWESATIGIGEFTDKNFGTLYGIVLPALVGTLLAGQNLIIESEKQDGGVAVFKMDAEGASLHNASFNLYGSTGGRIDMGAILGLVGGDDPDNMFFYDQFNNPTGVKTANNKSVTKVEDLDANDTPNANFWLDMDGGLYIKGVIDAVGGIFRGSLEVGGSTAFRVDAQGNLKIGGTATNPNFSVDANGNLMANTGTFKGTVQGATYKDSSGNIMMNANQQFKSDYLCLNGINVGNGQFVVDAAGNVTVSGSINMGAGSSINWATVTEQNASMSLAYIQATDAFNYAGQAYDKAGNAYNLATDAYDYADYAYDLAYENRITDQKVFDVLTGGGTKFGIFSDSSTNRLYINANYIRSGTIDADIVTLGSGWGGFACARGSTGISVTYGAKMYGSDEDYYFIATNAGVRMQAPDNGITITNNVISASEEITVSSDRRIKNSISYDMEKYSGFFMSLKPSFYRFNKGSSQRFHIGFIAQDVEEALLDNGLGTSDFAGFIRCAGAHDVHDQYLDQCYLRYSDFISLNTFMIQKLYREMEQKEKRIKYLEEKLAQS